MYRKFDNIFQLFYNLLIQLFYNLLSPFYLFIFFALC